MYSGYQKQHNQTNNNNKKMKSYRQLSPVGTAAFNSKWIYIIMKIWERLRWLVKESHIELWG